MRLYMRNPRRTLNQSVKTHFMQATLVSKNVLDLKPFSPFPRKIKSFVPSMSTVAELWLMGKVHYDDVRSLKIETRMLAFNRAPL